MCGIAVILHGSAVQTPTCAIDRMVASLRHRGPDEQSAVHLPGCDLGHTRLSVIDLAGGHQPMSDETGRYCIVFNGEIYNYRELRKELEQLGHRFRTNSDTEVLLQAYVAYGEQVVSRLNGQFAFAIWDQVEQSLLVARDRMGEKPLYWARDGQGRLIFASEIKAILASQLVQPRLDLASVDAYIALFYVPPDRTIYENVHTIRAGHAAIVKAGEVRQWRYWQPRYSSCDMDEREAVERIRHLMGQAIRRQMVADVPVGAFLSGGLDSSTTVALMSQATPRPVRTFAVGFGNLINELPYAREVADLYRTDHHELQMDIDVAAMLQRMMQVYDEPFGDSSNIPTYLLCEYARRHATVALSGDGGDEIFGGYSWYTNLLNLQANGAPVPPDWFERHLGSATHVLFDRSALWSPRPAPDTAALVRRGFCPPAAVSEMDRASFFDIECYLPGDILVKVDRATMAHGLETRAPFLDVDLVEFVLNLPWRMRFRDGTLKHLLRQGFADLWPASLRSRGKQGFGAPTGAWLAKPAVHEMWQRVTAADSPLCAVLPGVPRTIDQMRPQRRWTLLCLGLWLEGRTECLANLK